MHVAEALHALNCLDGRLEARKVLEVSPWVLGSSHSRKVALSTESNEIPYFSTKLPQKYDYQQY